MTEEVNKTFIIPNCIMCFPHSMFEKPMFKGKKSKKYEGQFIMDPTDKANKPVLKAIMAEKARLIADVLEGEEPEDRLCAVKTFDMHTKKGRRPEYEDMLYIKAKSSQKPMIVDRAMTRMEDDDERIYGGAECLIKVELWAVDGDYGATIGANLMVVQWTGEGESFGSGGVSEEEALEGLEELEPEADLFG